MTRTEAVLAHVAAAGMLLWQTLAVTMRLLVDARLLGGTPIVGADFKDMRFHAPLLPGEAITVRAKAIGTQASKSRPERGFLDMKVSTMTVAGSPLVTRSWRLVLPTRVGAASR